MILLVSCAIGAVVFSAASFGLYIWDTVLGDARPNLVSFGLWTVLEAIGLAAQASRGMSLTTLFMSLLVAGTGAISCLCVCGYGYANYGKLDAACALLALLGLAAWRLTGDPIAAVALSIAADACVAAPTVVKAWREPHSESLGAWLAMPASAGLTIAATRPLTPLNTAYPAWGFLLNLAVALLLLFRRRSRTAVA